jgi:hypothetical protein
VLFIFTAVETLNPTQPHSLCISIIAQYSTAHSSLRTCVRVLISFCDLSAECLYSWLSHATKICDNRLCTAVLTPKIGHELLSSPQPFLLRDQIYDSQKLTMNTALECCFFFKASANIYTYTLRINYEETSQRRRPNIGLLRDDTRRSR